MKKIIVIVVALFLSQSIATSYAKAPERTVNEYTPQELVSKYASQYQVSEKTMLTIMYCESGGSMNPKGSNDNGHARGLFQYHQSTFDNFSDMLGEKLDRESALDQVKLTAFALSKGLGHSWTCFKRV